MNDDDFATRFKRGAYKLDRFVKQDASQDIAFTLVWTRVFMCTVALLLGIGIGLLL